MKTLKHNFFRTLSSKFDQKRSSTLPYCQTALFARCSLKEATDSFFLRAFLMKVKNKIWSIFFQSHISRFDQKKDNIPCFFGCHVEFSCLWTGYSMKRAIHHKNKFSRNSRKICNRINQINFFVLILFNLREVELFNNPR